MNLLAKAAKRQDGQRLSTPFVLVRPPTKASDTQPKERCSASQSTSSQAFSLSTAPTVSGPIGMFCQDIRVDAESFFSLEVKGQVTFIAEIGKVAKVWAVPERTAPVCRNISVSLEEVGVADFHQLHSCVGVQDRQANG